MACVSQNSNEVQEQWRRNGLRARGEEDGAIFKLILYNQRLSVNVKILKFMGGETSSLFLSDTPSGSETKVKQVK